MKDKAKHRVIAKASYRRQHGVTDQRPCRDCRVLRDSPRVGRCPPCAKARREVMRALREGR